MLQGLVFGNQLAIGDTVICRWSQHLSLLIVTIKTKHNMDVTVIDSTGPVGHSRWLWWGPEFPVLSGLAFQISFLCVPQVTGRCFYMQHCLVDERKKNSVCSLSLLPFIREYKISFGYVCLTCRSLMCQPTPLVRMSYQAFGKNSPPFYCPKSSARRESFIVPIHLL